MVDWSGEKTIFKNGQKEVYKLWEVHLQQKFRGIRLTRTAGGNSMTVYYFIGNPHDTNKYNVNPGSFYSKALDTLATRWSDGGQPPPGRIPIGGTGITANYRGTSMATNVNTG